MWTNEPYCKVLLSIVIKRTGIKVVNDVLFLSQMTLDYSSKTLFPHHHPHSEDTSAPEIALLTSYELFLKGFFYHLWLVNYIFLFTNQHCTTVFSPLGFFIDSNINNMIAVIIYLKCLVWCSCTDVWIRKWIQQCFTERVIERVQSWLFHVMTMRMNWASGIVTMSVCVHFDGN